MHYITRVHILDSRESLTEESETLLFCDDSVIVLISEESAILSELHDHIDNILLD